MCSRLCYRFLSFFFSDTATTEISPLSLHDALPILIMPAAIAKWAILAPIFIPLLIRLGVTPQTVLAAYRVGDSPLNVLTPLMAYFPLIVVFVKRYQKSAGIGTVVSLMLPYVLILSVAWVALFIVWYLIGIPLGPGSPVHT